MFAKKVCMKPMDHYQFQRECALAWIGPDGYEKVGGYKTPTDDVLTILSISSSKKRTRTTHESLYPLGEGGIFVTRA